MESIQHILNQIPIRHDLASQLMFLGVVQGFFLAVLILIRAKKTTAIAFLGWTILFQSLVFFDTYLCYTGLIKYALQFNDSSEAFVLMIAPAFYFFIYAALKRKSPSIKKLLPHFILPFFYFITQIPFYIAPIAVKLNAYLGAYYNTIQTATVPESFNYSYHWIKDEFDWLILASFLYYTILGIILVWKEKQRIREIPHQANWNKYRFTRNAVILIGALLVIIFLVLYRYDDDGGDHYIGIIQTLIAYSTSYVILMESRFFENSWFADKYETISSNTIDFEKIEGFLNSSNYFLSQDASLKGLAEKLDASTNSISKTINSQKGLNFNDYMNQKRVEVLKIRLISDDFKHLTLEAIGNSVGFKSKSTFYSAFKKHAHTSPSAFIKAKKAQYSPEL
ncbi:helix-turn-helix domain-containing protein [Croceitalea rosinachiae]|uniref:Helix-turn-helix domain-containing protein n=1 Tax=Croceitalea rosinachiae TaxID=3075596 RepID=A0ABU3A919_9FLAO|nr:helix-turn-helix domain-containing protein [Croceitalea sp. F388]MDT0606679.1 helix-turn-helix domain-containing protein [Croceitalea sp. F388]